MAKNKVYNLLNLKDVREAISQIEKRKHNLVKVNKYFLIKCSNWLKLTMDSKFQENGGTYPIIDESTNNYIYNISDDFEVSMISANGVQTLTLKSISQQTTYAEFGIGAVGKTYSKNTDGNYQYDVDSPYKRTPKSGGARFWFHTGPDDLSKQMYTGKPGIYFAYDAFWDLTHLGLIDKFYKESLNKYIGEG